MHHVSCGQVLTAAENQSGTRSETIEARQLRQLRQLKLWRMAGDDQSVGPGRLTWFQDR